MYTSIISILQALFFVNHSSTQAEEHTDITKTKQYEVYKNFAYQLKIETDKNLQFNNKTITDNTTDIDTLLNNSIPNWKGLNVGTSVSHNDKQENGETGSIPLIFISFSMPEELIKNYITEAKLYGGMLVLRGLINNSIKQTVTQLKAIEDNNKKSDLSIVIHPHLFKLYDIKQVPAIVVSKDNTPCILKYDDCSSLYTYDKISGSITIKYAMEEIEKNGSSLDLKAIAKEILSKRKNI